MEYTIEELDGKLNRLISILCTEQKIDINKFHLQDCSLGDKRMIFRGLSNQRQPEPLSAEFIRLQDEILSYERDHKIIIDVNKLQYKNNMTIFWEILHLFELMQLLMLEIQECLEVLSLVIRRLTTLLCQRVVFKFVKNLTF
jgi:hypothetical protein